MAFERVAVVVGLLVTATAPARAQAEPAASPAGPIRIAIECESYGRTKACPAFLLGFVDANQVLLSAPRSDADVTLYASAASIALEDMIHLRFVGNVAGAPPVIEVDVGVDTRADDDAQRAQLEPAFLRGVALFVAARHPAAVTVALAAPEVHAVAKPSTTPWDVGLNVGGFGSWTSRYQSYSGYGSVSLSRLERMSRAALAVSGNAGLNRQPPLILDDGTRVNLNSRNWNISATGQAAWLHDDCWSFGGSTRVWRDDPKGEFRYGWNAKAGVEWDKYAADDPRGNRLAALYYAGYQVEGYNIRNELGERFAHYPIHGVVASGTIRKDKVGVGVSVSIGGELIHPRRRHHVSASPFIEWQIGAHVDATLSFSVTKRELPAPDPDAIDAADFEQLSRLSYAEALSMNGSFSLSIHWDRTNAARNDRFSDI